MKIDTTSAERAHAAERVVTRPAKVGRAKPAPAPVTREIRVYRLGKDDAIEYVGRATVEIVERQILEQLGASSRLEPVKVECATWDLTLYKLEEEQGYPAVFLGRKDTDPPGLK